MLINQTRPDTLLLSGWSKAVSVSGEPDDGYSVYMDLKFQDGTYAYGRSSRPPDERTHLMTVQP